MNIDFHRVKCVAPSDVSVVFELQVLARNQQEAERRLEAQGFTIAPTSVALARALRG